MIRTHKPRGFAWNCASEFQQTTTFREIDIRDCTPPLVAGDEYLPAPKDRSVKRRKIEELADGFLNGNQLYVHSARLPCQVQLWPFRSRILTAQEREFIVQEQNNNQTSSLLWREDQDDKAFLRASSSLPVTTKLPTEELDGQTSGTEEDVGESYEEIRAQASCRLQRRYRTTPGHLDQPVMESSLLTPDSMEQEAPVHSAEDDGFVSVPPESPADTYHSIPDDGADDSFNIGSVSDADASPSLNVDSQKWFHRRKWRESDNQVEDVPDDAEEGLDSDYERSTYIADNTDRSAKSNRHDPADEGLVNVEKHQCTKRISRIDRQQAPISFTLSLDESSHVVQPKTRTKKEKATASSPFVYRPRKSSNVHNKEQAVQAKVDVADGTRVKSPPADADERTKSPGHTADQAPNYHTPIGDKHLNQIITDKTSHDNGSTSLKKAIRDEWRRSGAEISKSSEYPVSSPAAEPEACTTSNMPPPISFKTSISQKPTTTIQTPRPAWEGTQSLINQAQQKLLLSNRKRRSCALSTSTSQLHSNSPSATSLSQPAPSTSRRRPLQLLTQESLPSTQTLIDGWKGWSTVKKPRLHLSGVESKSQAALFSPYPPSTEANSPVWTVSRARVEAAPPEQGDEREADKEAAQHQQQLDKPPEEEQAEEDDEREEDERDTPSFLAIMTKGKQLRRRVHGGADGGSMQGLRGDVEDEDEDDGDTQKYFSMAGELAEDVMGDAVAFGAMIEGRVPPPLRRV